MRIAVAGFMHETNTFVPHKTGMIDFTTHSVLGRILEGPNFFDITKTFFSMRGFLGKAAQSDYDIVTTLFAEAEPGGIIERDVFEQITERVLRHLGDQQPFDGLYLELHGAMVVDGFEDGELELLRRVRKAVGNIPIVVSLDLHGNISVDLFQLTDAMVGYRKFPHTDTLETGEKAFALLDWMLRHGKRPYKAFRKLPFLIPTSRQGSAYEPMKSFYQFIEDCEAQDNDLFSMSLMAGFVAADISICGPTIFSYGRTAVAADQYADALLAQMIEKESSFGCTMIAIDDAVAQALAVQKGSIVLADAQDNPGGGGNGDTTFIMRALLACGAPDAIVGMIHDENAVKAAGTAGVGATITIPLGGRMPEDQPLYGTFEVERYFDNAIAHLDGPMMRGTVTEMGPTAVLKIGGLRIVTASIRLQCLDQGFFRAVGIDPREHKIIVVKSTLHYQADFQSIASSMIMVKAPGYYRMNPRDTKYKNLPATMRFV